MRLTALAVVLATALPVAVAEVTINRDGGAPTAVLPVRADIGGESQYRGIVSHGEKLPSAPKIEHTGYGESDPYVELPIESTPASSRAETSIGERTADAATHGQLAQFDFAQFQVPAGTREGTGPSQREARAMVLPAALKFQYALGSDSEITYLRNPDLNNSVRDGSVIAAPTFFTLLTYRPKAWLETTLELTLERLIALDEEPAVPLPDGTTLFAERKRTSLLVDQLYVTFKEIGSFDFTVGRRNFEDGRLWLYDAALDGFIAKHKKGSVHTEVSATREDFWDGELLFNIPKGTINNYMVYSEYRGIEDHKLAAYAIKRYDRAGKEGRPLLTGVRAYGRPADSYNYWVDLGFSRGVDEFSRKLSGYGFDVGATYRFMERRFQPTVTLGFAYGSGDDNPDDNMNRGFRQTGLQSNEGRFGGVTQFKTYGEMLDPELTNIRVFTAGYSFRPASNAFVDLVYHRYRLNEFATELRSSGVTALMNKDLTRLSRDVGSEFDLILGFRNLFGLRRFGFEARIGWFFPGDAYRIQEGDPLNPTFRKPDTGVSMLIVFIL
jgi:alginate production protein